MNAIRIGEVETQPGKQQSINLQLSALYSNSPVSMPVHVIHGRKPGPVLFVSAAIHGDEINGVEIIRRLKKHKSIQRTRGALILVPVVNVYGFLSGSRYLPDRRDLNRSFPGSEKGSMASRLAHIFMQEIVQQCTHGIDIHTGAIGRENLPQIRAKIVDAPETLAMAHAFGTPVILNSELRDGSLREAVAEHGTPVLLYEAGEALRFDEVSIRAGVKGVLNVMRHLSMLPSVKKRKPQPEPLIAKSSQWLRAPRSGILRTIVPMGSQVDKGDVAGWIADPFGEKDESVLATTAGIIIGKTNHPLVHEGEAIIHIARFGNDAPVTESLEAFQDEHDPLTDEAPDEEPVIV